MLGSCLMAWSQGEEDIDAQAGAIVLAEFVNLVRNALKKR